MILEHEQTQLFLFTSDYLLSFGGRPGCFTLYISAFLMQFFRFPLLGSIIAAGLLTALAAVFAAVLRLFRFHAPLLPFFAILPSLLLLPAGRETGFLASVISLICALLGFLLCAAALRHLAFVRLSDANASPKVKVSAKRSFSEMIFLALIIYPFSGGNILLTAALLLIYGFSMRIYAAALVSAAACSVMPLLFWLVFCTAPLQSFYCALTPLAEQQRLLTSLTAWLLFAFLCIRLPQLLTIVLVSACLAATLFFEKSLYRRDAERLNKMVICAAEGKWGMVLDAARKMRTSPYKCFYTNLALQQSGFLPDSMFRHPQIGALGLLPDDGNFYINFMKSEYYYRLGIINEAHHRTFDALVGGAEIKEPAVRCLRRLKECALLQNNAPLADKYESLFQASLFYADKFNTPPAITPVNAPDILIQDELSLLESVLRHNPRHKAAFEYLMAFYLLNRNYDKAFTCFDTYFEGLDYPALPVHYAEFLTLYHRLNALGDEFFASHHVPQHIRDAFEVMELYLTVQITPEVFKNIEKLYGNTYWFYVTFPLINASEIQRHENTVY